MKAVNKIIMENDCKPVWLSNYGQNYIEYAKAGKRYRIWIEDKKSVKLKSDLVAKYNLKEFLLGEKALKSQTFGR